MYPKKKVIDISDRIMYTNYEFFIKIGIKNGTIMVTERNSETQVIFDIVGDVMGDVMGDIIVIYGDCCVMCGSSVLEEAQKAIDRLILGDNNNECKICCQDTENVRSSCCITCGHACCQNCLLKLKINMNSDSVTIKCPFCQDICGLSL